MTQIAESSRVQQSRAPSDVARELKIVVVMPAFNAARTLRATYDAIDTELIDEVILVDDCSSDDTITIARELGVRLIAHERNLGYGGNQKTCYREALRRGADIVVMLHPDGQYDAAVLPLMIQPICEGRADLVLGSRMLQQGGARAGGMPLYKYLANRALSWLQNKALGRNLAEYHTGYRAFSRECLEKIPFDRNSNGFIFDSEILLQAIHFGQRIHEVPVATRYFDNASSLTPLRSLVYGIRTLFALARYLLHRAGLRRDPLFLPPES